MLGNTIFMGANALLWMGTHYYRRNFRLLPPSETFARALAEVTDQDKPSLIPEETWEGK